MPSNATTHAASAVLIAVTVEPASMNRWAEVFALMPRSSSTVAENRSGTVAAMPPPYWWGTCGRGAPTLQRSEGFFLMSSRVSTGLMSCPLVEDRRPARGGIDAYEIGSLAAQGVRDGG